MKSDNAFTVAIYGIPDFERELVGRILVLSESRDTIYRMVEGAKNHTADIALVDTSNEEATGEFERVYSKRKDFPSVVIANGKDPECVYWIKRPFTAMRMLGALDKLVEDRRNGAYRPQPPVAAQRQIAPEPELPTREVTPKAASPSTTTAEAAPETYKALVVDDSLPVRKQVGVALRRAGITAEFAEDAESALKLIETRRYDILFLDVVLPGKDGYEICKAVKKDKDKKHIPVVMLTGKSSHFDKVKGKLSGCDAYLTKPVSLKEFNETLSRWLNPPLSFESTADET